MRFFNQVIHFVIHLVDKISNDLSLFICYLDQQKYEGKKIQYCYQAVLYGSCVGEESHRHMNHFQETDVQGNPMETKSIMK